MILRLLETVDYDTNTKRSFGNFPLHLGSWKSDNPEVIKRLVERGADVNAKNRWLATPLHFAAAVGNISACSGLLQSKDLDPNITTAAGLTALHYATARERHKHVLSLLLLKGGQDVNYTDVNERGTALHIAVGHLNTEILEVLLECPEVNLNIGNHHGRTALIIASLRQRVDMIELLSSRVDLDFNALDLYGRSALSYAASQGFHDGVQRLLLLSQRTLDINKADMNGRTVLSHAAESGHFDIVDLLCQQPDIDKGMMVGLVQRTYGL
ncbi:ankyrin [Eremomyces bilateralis CBS 781.70]|uniref:Ankyrin n=1 Tax=Eremomyces bilateralis CBS 781.70 TaxID=1392243 RepID=A0A6G1FST1_9PEZI|nr:ankyrin [Eremomyces bilateralis CBS 781.70]KAF1808925.1 ankyrin [Eremomyces bilateralis CBS 781.70]